MKGFAKKYEIDKLQMLKVISMCGAIERCQLSKLLRVDETVLDTLINGFADNRRLVRNTTYVATDIDKLNRPQNEVIAAVWVLINFIERVDYYTSGDFPAQFCFFADGVEYEIIYAALGQEAIINKAVTTTDESPKRLVIIEDMEQINKLKLPNIAAYCMVAGSGDVKFYKRGI